MKRIVSTIGLAVALAALACAGPILPTIQTLPASGNVAGFQGTAVGWGFTLTYTGTDWLVLNDSNFTGSTVFGSYLDYLTLSNAPLYVVGPAPESSSITQAWDPASTPPLGLGEFDINPTAQLGPIGGNIAVDYTLFSQDPNDPNFDPGSFVSTGTLDAPVQIAVVPEPGSMVFLGVALLPFGLAIRRRRT